MTPEPVCHLVLAQFSGGERENGADGIFRLKNNLHAVERQEKAREHPSRALVAIGKRMVAGDAKGKRRRERARIILAIGPLVDWPRQRRFQRTEISHASNAAMLCQLAIMDSKGNFRF